MIAVGLGLVVTRARFSVQDGGTRFDFANGLLFRPAFGLSSTRIPLCQRGKYSILRNVFCCLFFFLNVSFICDFSCSFAGFFLCEKMEFFIKNC